MTTTRAKFRCNSVTDFGGNSRKVALSPVYPGPDASDEDKAFWTATPSGTLEMQIDNPAAAVQFVPGSVYYVDFTLAEG